LTDECITIREVTGDSDIVIMRELFREYQGQLQVDLQFQRFHDELERLPGAYSPPEGCLLMAEVEGKPAGCVALKPRAEDICEMKRLYVRPACRGLGIGRKLAKEVIRRAGMKGYAAMVLDTLDRLVEAMALYESLGFQRTEPYYDNPLPGVVYWRLDLTLDNSISNGGRT
jgi:putative acetyltransferase